MKNAVFWDVMPCGSCKNQHLGGTYHLHHQGDSELGTQLAISAHCEDILSHLNFRHIIHLTNCLS
jgi:hypothetical protein